MSTKQFRADLFAIIAPYMATNFPQMQVAWENGPEIDEESVTVGFLDVEIRWYGAKPAEVGQGSPTRHSGAVAAHVYIKQATGTAVYDDVIDGLCSLLKTRRVGAAHLMAPQRTVPTPLKGWQRSGVLVPFVLDVG